MNNLTAALPVNESRTPRRAQHIKCIGGDDVRFTAAPLLRLHRPPPAGGAANEPPRPRPSSSPSVLEFDYVAFPELPRNAHSDLQAASSSLLGIVVPAGLCRAASSTPSVATHRRRGGSAALLPDTATDVPCATAAVVTPR